MPLAPILGRRLLGAAALIAAVLVLNFVLIRLAPGDAALTIAGGMGGATEDILRDIRRAHGLDAPLHHQLFLYMERMLSGDLGHSLFFDAPVIDLILDRLGPTILLVTTAMAIALSWPPVARLARAEFLRIRELDHVRASRAIGASDARLIWRVILPGALPPLIAAASLAVGGAILFEAGLAFLGLGDPDTMSWGLMIGANRDFLREAWWAVTLPGIAIFVTVLGVSLIGDGLTDALDPRRRGR